MAQSQANLISQPLTLGDLTLKNRNVMASLTRNRNLPTSIPNDVVRDYYVQRAKGGAGLIMTEGTLVSQQGTEWPNAPGIWSEEHVKGWKKVTDAVHEAGSLIFCQLWHVGRVAHPDMPEQIAANKPVPAPSAIAADGGKFRTLPGQPGYVTPTAIEDPWTIVAEFKKAAEYAKKAGFDGVELHSANGYLPHQFLDYTSNQRTDQWGGSIENRARFGLECVKAMIEVWGPARVGIKVNPAGGYNDVGMPLPDTIATFTYYLTQISALKPAYIQLVRYAPMMDAPITVKPSDRQIDDGKKLLRGIPHDIVAVYGGLVKPPTSALESHTEAHLRGPAMPSPDADKRNPTPTRLFVNGGMTLDQAEELLGQGAIDAAVFGFPWITNPDLQQRFEKGLPLNFNADFATLYNGKDGDISVGYTTYPTAQGSA